MQHGRDQRPSLEAGTVAELRSAGRGREEDSSERDLPASLLVLAAPPPGSEQGRIGDPGDSPHAGCRAWNA